MKKYFKMVCKDKNNVIKVSSWIDTSTRKIKELNNTYLIAIKKYNLICNIEYMEVFENLK